MLNVRSPPWQDPELYGQRALRFRRERGQRGLVDRPRVELRCAELALEERSVRGHCLNVVKHRPLEPAAGAMMIKVVMDAMRGLRCVCVSV